MVLTFFGFMHGDAVGIVVTPTVAVARQVVVLQYALGRYPVLAPASTGQCRLRRRFCIAGKPDFVGLGLTQEALKAPFYRKLLAIP